MINVVVNNVSKQYAVTALDKREKLKSVLLQRWFGLNFKGSPIKYKEAVKSISFTVERGQSLAFIGKNGAGKSTLLKMISGSLTPDSGELDIKGQVGGLIELGAGLIDTKTGRENVEERSKLLGIPVVEASQFIEEIENFAELAEQFDDPVNTYSSGMKARLGFAISVTLPFDIMICDEALSVGDASFTAKCLAKINELKKERIFLFVSHSMTMVQRFCDRAIVIDKGEMVFSGKSSDAVAYYENKILHMIEETEESTLPVSHQQKKEVIKQNRIISQSNFSFLEPILHNTAKVDKWSVNFSCDQSLEIDWEFNIKSENPQDHKYKLGFPVYSAEGTMLFSCTNEDLLKDLNSLTSISGQLSIVWHGLNPGIYQIVIALYEDMEPILRQHLGEIKIQSTGTPYFGLYSAQHEWIVNEQF